MKAAERKAKIEAIIKAAKDEGKIITPKTAEKLLDQEIAAKQVEDKISRPKTKKGEPEKKTDTKKTEPAKLTKKAIIVGLLRRKEGASLDECAEAITKSGIDPDTKKNRSTSLLYMSKIGFEVVRDEEGRYYPKA